MKAIRSDVVGSLLRPAYLVDARRQIEVGHLSPAQKPRLESVEEVRHRIAEASKFVPLERLALSPQCGFASTMEGNRISPEAQRQKLQLVADTARAMWQATN